MNTSIITISRQFGSGGREVGKRLADALGYSYYDKELIAKVAENSGFHPDFIESNSESSFTRSYSYTFARSFSVYNQSLSDKIQIEQNKVIKEVADKGNAVIIGRCADYVLSDEKPFKVFIYSSDMGSRIKRCYDKVPEDKTKSAKEMEKSIRKIDKTRSKYYEFYTGQSWSNLENYNLCIDTSTVGVMKAVEIIISALGK